MLKCYHVEDKNAEHQQLVFADKRSAAILQSEAYEWDGEYIAVRALRQPAYDKYAEQGYVPKAVLLADGWWFTCYGRTDSGYVCGKELRAEDNPLVIGDHVYCNAHCATEVVTDGAA